MKRLALITFILGAALAIVPVASAVVAMDGVGSSIAANASSAKPAGMTQAEYHALFVRGEALNARWGNHITDLTPQQFKQAIELSTRTTTLETPVRGVPTGSSGSTLAWRYIALAALGSLLLAYASVTFTRRRHQLGF